MKRLQPDRREITVVTIVMWTAIGALVLAFEFVIGRLMAR